MRPSRGVRLLAAPVPALSMIAVALVAGPPARSPPRRARCPWPSASRSRSGRTPTRSRASTPCEEPRRSAPRSGAHSRPRCSSTGTSSSGTPPFAITFGGRELLGSKRVHLDRGRLARSSPSRRSSRSTTSTRCRSSASTSRRSERARHATRGRVPHDRVVLPLARGRAAGGGGRRVRHAARGPAEAGAVAVRQRRHRQERPAPRGTRARRRATAVDPDARTGRPRPRPARCGDGAVSRRCASSRRRSRGSRRSSGRRASRQPRGAPRPNRLELRDLARQIDQAQVGVRYAKAKLGPVVNAVGQLHPYGGLSIPAAERGVRGPRGLLGRVGLGHHHRRHPRGRREAPSGDPRQEEAGGPGTPRGATGVRQRRELTRGPRRRANRGCRRRRRTTAS